MPKYHYKSYNYLQLYTKTCLYQSIDRENYLCVLQGACHELFCIFGDIYAPVTQVAEVPKSQLPFNLFIYKGYSGKKSHPKCEFELLQTSLPLFNLV